MTKRPAGSTAVATSALILLLNKVFHVDLPQDTAIIIVGSLTAIVSALFPNLSDEIHQAERDFDGSAS